MTTSPSDQVQDRQIKYLPLSELQENPRNPKKHDQATLTKSVTRFGYIDPIVRDERTGYIISGHGRFGALKDLQATHPDQAPEGVRVDESGDWLVPVVTGWASRDDIEAEASLIALNRVNELGGWDDEALLDLLNDLKDNDPAASLEGIGFDLVSIDDLNRALAPDEADLDELSDLWDGETGISSKPSEVVDTDPDNDPVDDRPHDEGEASFNPTIHVKADVELLARWDKWEVQWNSPSQALSELLSRAGF